MNAEDGGRFLSTGGADRWQSPAFQAQLWELLAERTGRYLMGDHSSLPVEQAQELFTSICFCVGARLELGGPADGLSVAQLWQEGLGLTRQRTASARRLYERVRAQAECFGNLGMRDTLDNIAAFFQAYDPEFFAHHVPCSIDYPLSDPVPDRLAGVRFLDEYLRRLRIENRVCRAFPHEGVEARLRACVPDFRVQLINLFDAVFPTAVGLALLGDDPAGLRIRRTQREQLRALFGGVAVAEANLTRGAAALAERIGLTDAGDVTYLTGCARLLAPRAVHAVEAGGLEGLFPSGEG